VKHIGLILLALFIAGCNKTQKDDNKPTTKVTKEHNTTKKVQNAILNLDNNDTIKISSQSIQTTLCESNQTIIINVFATWAKSSLNQLNTLDILEQKHDICIVSVALDSNKTATNISNISHKVIFGLQNNDFVDKITHMIKIDKNFKLPLNLIYKNTQFIDSYQGVMPYEMLEYIIKG
jgi:hypothetical protein